MQIFNAVLVQQAEKLSLECSRTHSAKLRYVANLFDLFRQLSKRQYPIRQIAQIRDQSFVNGPLV